MKFLICCLALGFGLAAALLPKNLRPNEEYKYEYRAQILSGLPQTSKITAGILLKAKVKLIVLENVEDVILKMENIALRQIVKELSQEPSTRIMLPDEEWQQVPPNKLVALERELKKPCKFSYKNGFVSNIRADVSEPDWSLNMKKAILQTTQLDLDKVSVRERRPYSPIHQQVQESEEEESEKTNEMFTTKETTLFGECEPKYSIRSVPSLHCQTTGEKVLNISKVIDPLKCKNSPIISWANNAVEFCEECPQYQKKIINTHFEQTIDAKGTKNEFEIEKCTLQSVQSTYPFNTEAGSYTTYIRAEFKKLEKRPASRVSQPQWKPITEGLKMTVPELEPTHLVTFRRLKDQIITEIKEKIMRMPEESEEKKPEKIIHLLTLLREASVTDLQILIRQIFPDRARPLSDKETTLKRILFVELLPFVRTQECTEVVKQEIDRCGRPSNCMLTGMDMTEIFAMWSLGGKVTKRTVSQVEETCRLTHIKRSPMLKKACNLCYAAKLKKLVREDRTVNDVSFITRQIQIIEEKLEDARTEEDQILAVKLLAAVPHFAIPKIMYVVKDVRKPKIVRIEALKALEGVCKYSGNDERCCELLFNGVMPVFTNRAEVTEVRVAAFRVIMSCKPKTSILHLIARCLSHERNVHLSSYCYTYMVTVSRSTMPCYRKWANQVRQVMKLIRPIQPGAQFSKALFQDYYSEILRQGIQIESSYLTTPRSIVPKTAQIKSDIFMFGRQVNLFELNVYTQGLQRMMKKMFGPSGSIHKSDSVFDLIRRQRRSSDAPDWKSMAEQKLKNKLVAPESPKVAVFWKLLGVEMPFVDIDSMFLRNLIEDGRLRIEDIDQKLRNGIPIDIKRNMIIENAETVVPTAVGIPLKMKLQALASVKVEGKAHLIVKPKLFRLERNMQAPHEVKVEVNAEPKVNTIANIEMELALPVLKMATKTKILAKSELPIDVKVKVEPFEEKIFTEVKPVQKKTEIVKMETIPEVYVMCLPEPMTKLTSLSHVMFTKKIAHLKPHIREPVVYNPLRESEINTCDWIGLDLETQVKYSKIHAHQSPIWPLNGESEVKFAASPCSMSPRKYTMDIDCKMVTPDSPSEDRDWKMIEKLPNHSNLKYRKVIMKLKAIRSQNTKELMMSKFYMVYDKEIRTALTDLHMRVRPLKSGETMKMCSMTEMKLPSLPEQFTRPLPVHQLAMPVQWKLVFAEWDQCYQRPPAIEIKIHPKKSNSQQRTESPEQYENSPCYRRCSQIPESERHRKPECERWMNKLSEMHEIVMEFTSDRDQVPTFVKRKLEKCPYVKNCPVIDNIFMNDKPSRKVTKMIIEMIPEAKEEMESLEEERNELIKMITFKLIENVAEEPMMMSYMLPYRLPAPSMRNYPETALLYATKGKIPAKFQLFDDKLTTFDGKRIPVRLTDTKCKVILVKNCDAAAKETEKFSVIAEKPQGNDRSKKLIVNAGNYYTVEVEPSYQAGTPVLKINGVRYNMNDRRRVIKEKHGDTELIVKLVNSQRVMIIAPRQGITVETDANKYIGGRVTHFSYGELCGLAGNFNGLKHDDVTGPNNDPYIRCRPDAEADEPSNGDW